MEVAGDQAAMRLGGQHFIRFVESHERGRCRIKHRVIGAIACAIGIAGLQQQLRRRQGCARFM